MEEHKIVNSGTTWLLPKKIDFCRINIDTEDKEQELVAWLNQHDVGVPHFITRINGSDDEIYITNIGKVNKYDWLYCDEKGKIQVGDKWMFPKSTVDVIDSECSPFKLNSEIIEVASRMLVRE